MKSIMERILGKSPVTSLLGILGAVIGIVHEALKAGETDYINIAYAVVVGLIGLKAADGSKK
jgi:hypothetical protein